MLFVVVMGTLWSVGHRDRYRCSKRSTDLSPRRHDHGLKELAPMAQGHSAGSLPFIVSGMKQGWAFAWRSLMAAEIYVTILTGFGLGQLLHYGREQQAMEQVIGVMSIIVVIGLLADKIFFSPIEKFLHRRWGTGSSQ